ncbi:hypothetical protein GCM10025867_03350 [Frondihabitans sucicola]|uniref:Uncharacterized protein n=1 Tax=Frondihabitans sucicola TaxID=1268041 RepID=A0ABN6XSZ4_9MICO|nr:hypothetical protein [Frondihabitans sucicola]BDZ48094.1 hypothetical protein GCM10025867_03350 [Frondihabitans sucicola]
MNNRTLTSLALAFASFIGLTACTAAEPERTKSNAPLPPVSIKKYGDVVAALDFDHATAQTPLSRIDRNAPRFSTKIFHAIAVGTDRCLTEQGFQEVSSKTDWSPYPESEDRQYGLWSVEYASKYGVSLAPNRGPRELDTLALGVEFNKAYADCMDSAKDDLKEILTYTDSPDIDSTIKWQSHDRTRASKAGKKALVDWRACMEKAGVVLDPDDSRPSAQYQVRSKEAEIKVSVLEAKCGVDTGAVRTLYDTQARYEAAYLDAQAAQVKAFVKKRDKVLHELDEAIAGR